MAKYDYTTWKKIIRTEIQEIGSLEDYHGEVILSFLQNYADDLNQDKNDYISAIVGLFVCTYPGLAVEQYILERFQKLKKEGFSTYVYCENPEFESDLEYLNGIHTRDLMDYTVASDRNKDREIDGLLGKYFDRKDRRALIDRRERSELRKICILSILGTMVILALVVMSCMYFFS